jgi:hypothetical protein
MITCPNCAHANPDGAINCEACFTELPIVKNIQCPSCHATVLSDAKFCGHCGFNLSAATAINPLPDIHPDIYPESALNSSIDPSTEAPSTESFPVLPISSTMPNALPDETTEGDSSGNLIANSASEVPTLPKFTDIEAMLATETNNEPVNAPVNVAAPISGKSAKTQLQQFSASLLHIQTNLIIEIPTHLPVVHIGKPNTVIPPDIDVSGFPDSDIVSRIHADIRAEGGAFYFEDTGSSNGTYINNLPLPAGNRHKLRAGDRISLGKGDKVSFVFQLSS